MTARILLVDGYALVRAGLKAIFAGVEMEVIAEAADEFTAMRLIEKMNPDVTVIGELLSGITAVELTAQLCVKRPDRKVVVLTAYEDKESLCGIMAAGAIGYVFKSSCADELVKAVRAAAEGIIYFDTSTNEYRAEASERSPKESDGEHLSEREREVMQRIALGYSNKEIAAHMRVSVKTVETYKARALEKLGIRSRVDIVHYASRRGWLSHSNGITYTV